MRIFIFGKHGIDQMPVQTTATATSAPEAKNLEISHSGVSIPGLGAWLPKISILDPSSSQPSALWNGTSVGVDFEIPDTVGKLTDAVAMIELRTTATAPTAGEISPTTHWVENVESYLGSQMIERVPADDLLNEAVLFLSDQELNTIAPLVNITNSGTNTSFAFAASTTYRFYLPLWATAINTAQPYCKGFKNKFKYRINFAPQFWTAAGANLTANTTPTIVQVKLIIQEAGLTPNDEAKLEAAHRSKIEYRTIRRNKHVSNIKDFTAQPAGEQTELLSQFANTDSAGLIVYARPGGATNQYANVGRYEMFEIGLLDGKNTQLVPRVPAQYLEGFVNPWSVSTSTGISQTPTNLYIFPFCSSLQRVLETGEMLGGLELTGSERLTYINRAAVGTLNVAQKANVLIHVESFEYCRIVVNRNASALVFKA
jgi:hypothetical protein